MFQSHININDCMKHHNVIGVSVSLINSGQISRIENYGLLEVGTNKKVDNNSIFNACSISKFLTAITVLKLTEQGILDLDEDVNKRLKSWKIPNNNLTDKKVITLRNLLSHQSGIIDPEDSFMELNPNIGIPSLPEIFEGTTPYCKAPIEVNYEPESDFQYSDAGFCIIQQLIEDVTGKPFEKVVKELIFLPLKMTNSTFLQNISEEIDRDFSSGHNKEGKSVDGKYPIYPYPAASGLWTTTSDLSQLILELMDALNNKSKIGISANKVKEMINSQGCKSWTGLGVFLDGSEKEIEISSLGWGLGFQCMLVAYPHLGNGLIITTNTDLGVHQLKGIIGEVYHSLKPLLNLA
ncbi:CubicO group peptidase, beta-lactamase class C family [Bacillus sp. OV322]|uniref:serine hydrolase domain-containing protein n=1 Tax=Bacillus sp. OV322 TaxID=1882764 RepID=UPI0008DF8D4C|nr:serine hydrolase domain-containing protein [Bacillus sp. OV322]SFC00092.1 CubicO group peptidase, beta-lactamase class C family [Bacillus sp. OV322]